VKKQQATTFVLLLFDFYFRSQHDHDWCVRSGATSAELSKLVDGFTTANPTELAKIVDNLGATTAASTADGKKSPPVASKLTTTATATTNNNTAPKPIAKSNDAKAQSTGNLKALSAGDSAQSPPPPPATATKQSLEASHSATSVTAGLRLGVLHLMFLIWAMVRCGWNEHHTAQKAAAAAAAAANATKVGHRKSVDVTSGAIVNDTRKPPTAGSMFFAFVFIRS
jgi:hypothetical protein